MKPLKKFCNCNISKNSALSQLLWQHFKNMCFLEYPQLAASGNVTKYAKKKKKKKKKMVYWYIMLYSSKIFYLFSSYINPQMNVLLIIYKICLRNKNQRVPYYTDLNGLRKVSFKLPNGNNKTRLSK